MATVQLVEDGDWHAASYTTDPDHDQFIQTGWRVITYEGQQLYRHDDKAACQAWLASQGYVDTGDVAHYRREA